MATTSDGRLEPSKNSREPTAEPRPSMTADCDAPPRSSAEPLQSTARKDAASPRRVITSPLEKERRSRSQLSSLSVAASAPLRTLDGVAASCCRRGSNGCKGSVTAGGAGSGAASGVDASAAADSSSAAAWAARASACLSSSSIRLAARSVIEAMEKSS